MILLVDAHALLWWLTEDQELSALAREAIEDAANDPIVSAATIWEIEIKRRRGKLNTPEGILDALAPRISVLPVDGADAVAAAALPPHHRDPFDRMVIAQANRLDAVIVSRDRVFAAYDVRQILA
jgi:PIN domain nuclease of toxin-antitoxin system